MMLISHPTFLVSLSLFSWPLNSAHQTQRWVLFPGKEVHRTADQDNRETYKPMCKTIKKVRKSDHKLPHI